MASRLLQESAHRRFEQSTPQRTFPELERRSSVHRAEKEDGESLRSNAATRGADHFPISQSPARRDELYRDDGSFKRSPSLNGNLSPFNRIRPAEGGRVWRWKHSNETFRIASAIGRSIEGQQLPILEGKSYSGQMHPWVGCGFEIVIPVEASPARTNQ